MQSYSCYSVQCFPFVDFIRERKRIIFMRNLAEIGINIIEVMPPDKPEQTVSLLVEELGLDRSAAEAAFEFLKKAMASREKIQKTLAERSAHA